MSKVKIVLIVDLNTDEVEQLTLKGNINELTAGVVMLINHGYENLKGKDREFFIKKINEFTSDPEKVRKEITETEIGDDRSKLEIDFNFNVLNNKFSVNLFLDEECFAGGCDENLEKALEFALIDTEKEINLDSDYREYNHKLDLVGAYLDEKR